MACINKSNKTYQNIEKRYGVFLAEVYTRSHPKNISMKANDDFYIPSLSEVSKIVKAEGVDTIENFDANMKQNPYMTEEFIRDSLKGVIRKHRGEYYVIKGIDVGPLQTAISIKEIFEKNYRVMNTLQSKYPQIISLRQGRKPRSFKVVITPQQKPEEVEERTIEPSLRAYARLVELNDGAQPKMFQSGPHRWQRVGNNLYTLIDEDTGAVFMPNVNLVTGMQEVESNTTPVDPEYKKYILNQVKPLNTPAMQVNLAERGYNMNLIIKNLESAETQEELLRVYKDFVKTVC